MHEILARANACESFDLTEKQYAEQRTKMIAASELASERYATIAQNFLVSEIERLDSKYLGESGPPNTHRHS